VQSHKTLREMCVSRFSARGAIRDRPVRGGFRRERFLFFSLFLQPAVVYKAPSIFQNASSLSSSCSDLTLSLALLLKTTTINRLYVRGVILGYKRARTNQYENTSLIKLENVPDKSSTSFYLGKKLCYVYKAHTKKEGTVYRTMWGKVTRAHGTSGVVRAQFKHNLPPTSIGGKIRCMLYPSNI